MTESALHALVEATRGAEWTITRDELREDAVVPCGSCRLCCYREKVVVFPDMGDRLDKLDVVEFPKALRDGASVFVLKQDPVTGACVHLGPEGCTVYEDRPVICRTFDCVAWAAGIPRNERRLMKRDPHARALLERGREIQRLKPDKGGKKSCLSGFHP